jgi:hypothetical protein
VTVGLPSGDAYTILLRMLGDREYRRQRGGASVSAAVGTQPQWRRGVKCFPGRSGDLSGLRAMLVLGVGRGRLEAVLSCLATVIPHS